MTGKYPSLQKEMAETYQKDDIERYCELEKIMCSKSSMKITLITDVHIGLGKELFPQMTA